MLKIPGTSKYANLLIRGEKDYKEYLFYIDVHPKAKEKDIIEFKEAIDVVREREKDIEIIGIFVASHFDQKERKLALE
ncbi:MAG: hypothetical protein ABDH49_01710 [Candidatus Hydrothermales bacterium]